MRSATRGLALAAGAAVAALLGACGGEQHETEQILLRWSVALNHHLATDIAGGNEYPHRLSDIDPMLRSDASFVDGWGHALYYRRVNDGMYDLASSGPDGTIGTADDVVLNNSTLYKPEKIYAERPADRGLVPQADAAGDGR